MNSPDSYDDLVPDPAVLNELDVIEAKLKASTSGPAPSMDQIPMTICLTGTLDAAKAEDYRCGCKSPSTHTLTDTPTDSQATLCGDDVFRGDSSSPPKLLLSPGSSPLGSPSAAQRRSIDRKTETDQSISNSKKTIGKRKARDLGDEEGTMGTQQGPSKRGRGRTPHSRFRNRPRPPPRVLPKAKPKAMRGAVPDSDDDPIDFLRSR
jgi:hypothetical protein